MFHLEGDVYEPRVCFSYLQHLSVVHLFICYPTTFYANSTCMKIAVHEKAASAQWYTEITFAESTVEFFC